MIQKIHKTEDEWREILGEEKFRVMRERGTEAPFCGIFTGKKESGTYVCAACLLPLFKSETKFESGTGWPSYFEPINSEHIEERQDFSHGMNRTEVVCARCESHLGHVFDDGPPPTGKRYCINSIALDFQPSKSSS